MTYQKEITYTFRSTIYNILKGMCRLCFDTKAVAFLRLHLAFSRPHWDYQLLFAYSALSFHFTIPCVFFLFASCREDFYQIYLKCYLTGHWNSEPSLVITMSSSTRKQVNGRIVLNHSWMRSRCLLHSVSSHIVPDHFKAREKFAKTVMAETSSGF